MTIKNTFSDSVDAQLSVLMGILSFVMITFHTGVCTCPCSFAAALIGIICGLHAMRKRNSVLAVIGIMISGTWFVLFFTMFIILGVLAMSF